MEININCAEGEKDKEEGRRRVVKGEAERELLESVGEATN